MSGPLLSAQASAKRERTGFHITFRVNIAPKQIDKPLQIYLSESTDPYSLADFEDGVGCRRQMQPDGMGGALSSSVSDHDLSARRLLVSTTEPICSGIGSCFPRRRTFSTRSRHPRSKLGFDFEHQELPRVYRTGRRSNR